MAADVGIKIKHYEVMQSTVNDKVLLIIYRILGDATKDAVACLGVIAACGNILGTPGTP